MDVLTVSEYRNNLGASFDRASEGERVLIRRKNTLYALVSVDNVDLNRSSLRKEQIEKMTESLRRSWDEVKQMESGKLPLKSAMSFIDEL